ncbi:hypothetical protein L226DRAFT_261520 [Lentinus tigrinus ALCF2SS1-7]|uniref:DUF6534 domain-containing protein n=1 Tax=Lentinus tigrinus ALCF2SS1-6 TaxID=1328759 RepID=A0A5C2RTA1_9APHY|nr:hypothetical protein L227DRAFT_580243 [Lentinus tigrinus ALCF2SS1-6]RPD69881.1 hypothetical protein L226DRAFT_261520 [Lentinus tigrinus ALCF2SS1-7]
MAAPPNTTATMTPLDPLALLPKVPALDNTFGAVLLGTFLALILYGLTLHQSYRYFGMYPGDSRILKGLVIVVLILETVTSIMSMHACYFYLVTSYFNPRELLRGTWSIRAMPLVSGLVMTASQSFFAWRVYIMGPRYRILVGAAAFLCILELGFSSAATAEAFIARSFQSFKHVTWLVSTQSTMAVTADILLTIVLIYVLRRSRTGIKRTDSMLEVMIMYSINTGLLTGIFNFLSLFFSFIRPGDMIYIGIGIPGTKMYANTLMAALNSRRSLAAKCSGPFLETSPFGFSISPEAPEDSAMMVYPPRVHVKHSIDPAATTDSMTGISSKSQLTGDLSMEALHADIERHAGN